MNDLCVSDRKTSHVPLFFVFCSSLSFFLPSQFFHLYHLCLLSHIHRLALSRNHSRLVHFAVHMHSGKGERRPPAKECKFRCQSQRRTRRRCFSQLFPRTQRAYLKHGKSNSAWSIYENVRSAIQSRIQYFRLNDSSDGVRLTPLDYEGGGVSSICHRLHNPKTSRYEKPNWKRPWGRYTQTGDAG